MSVVSLPTKAAFDAVFASPDVRKHHRDFLVLAKAQSHGTPCRIGFVTSKRKIRRAVDRNRFKRVFKAALQSTTHQASGNQHSVDYVIVAKATPDQLHTAQFFIVLVETFATIQSKLQTINENS